MATDDKPILTSRTVAATQTTGTISLRYAPRNPVPGVVKTDKAAGEVAKCS